MNRRTFLRLGALTPAMLALGGLPLAACAPAPRPPGDALLDPDESELLRAIVERLVATGEPAVPSAREVGAVAAIEGVLVQLDEELVEGLRLALRLVDWWPAVAELRFRRFRSLSPGERDQSLEGWRSSRFALRRSVFDALRNLALLGYWSRDATWASIGYPGPWLGVRP